MARKPLKPTPEPGFRADVRELDSRPLLTFDWDGWSVVDAVLASEDQTATRAKLKGAIVRVQPHADTTDARIAEFRAELEKAGAAVVRFLPRRKGRLLPQAERESLARKSARVIVEGLLDESFVEDRGRLKAFCEGIMDRVKL